MPGVQKRGGGGTAELTGQPRREPSGALGSRLLLGFVPLPGPIAARAAPVLAGEGHRRGGHGAAPRPA